MTNKLQLFIQPLNSDECGDDCPMLVAYNDVGAHRCVLFGDVAVFDWHTYNGSFNRTEACKNLEWNLKKHD